jgi:hypothetical protein
MKKKLLVWTNSEEKAEDCLGTTNENSDGETESAITNTY